MILAKDRDRRFITIRRGGTLVFTATRRNVGDPIKSITSITSIDESPASRLPAMLSATILFQPMVAHEKHPAGEYGRGVDMTETHHLALTHLNRRGTTIVVNETTMERLESLSDTLAELLTGFPDVIIVLDEFGRVKWGNHAAERMFGRSIEDSIDLPSLELVHPEDLELVIRSLASVRGKEIGTLIEVRVMTPSGWRLVEVLGAPVSWRNEEVVIFSLRDITDRRRFEVARNQEARLRSLVQNAPTVTMLVSPSGVVESVSGSLSRVLGHDPEFVENRPLAELVREDDRSALDAALKRATQGASAANPVTASVRLLRYASTTTVPFELALVNLLDDPTVRGIVVSAHDVTEREAAELELHKALSLLTATLDSTADGIVAVNEEGRISNFNRRFVEMWQLPRSFPATYSTWVPIMTEQLVRANDLTAKLDELRDSPEAESMDVLEFEDGRVFERYSTPQRIENDVVGRVWSFRDVTERKRIEEELRESVDRFRRAFKQGPIGIALLDLDLRITNVNDSLCDFLGRTRDELLGVTFESFTHDDDLKDQTELVTQLSERMIQRYQSETRFVTGDGTVVFGTVTGSMIVGDHGLPTSGLRVIEDITERKQLERELVSRAESASALLGRLTARETEILKLLETNETAPKMAEQLSVSVRTVESHLANAYRKLGVRSRYDAVAEFARLTRAVNGPSTSFGSQ